MTPDEYCQQKAAASGSSFYYSFLFLPPDRRRAITALYAFCREVDDVVDECHDLGVARTKLAWWRQEVGNVYHGQPQHPVARALAEGLTYDEVAERLGISPHTVHTHVKNIHERTGIRSTRRLLARVNAVRLGWDR